jgi:hypothetical protein
LCHLTETFVPLNRKCIFLTTSPNSFHIRQKMGYNPLPIQYQEGDFSFYPVD